MFSERELDVEAKENIIKVACRFSPANSGSGKRATRESIAEFPVPYDVNSLSIGRRVYNFDEVFSPDTSSEVVYNESGKFVVNHVLNGYNGSIFAYGSSLSHKVDTIEQGLMPGIVEDIFNNMTKMRPQFNFAITVSYYEIYKEKLYDLLNKKASLAVVEHNDGKVDVRGATERSILTRQDVFKALAEGKLKRRSTKLGKVECSSHSIFVIQVKRKNINTEQVVCGKLHLIDLAASMKMPKTGNIPTEARSINLSLLTLGNIVSKLQAGEKTHMRYRDSKLTRLLQDTLSPGARVSVILCCSANAKDEEETKAVLEFGRRLKTVSHNKTLIAEELSGHCTKLKQNEAKLSRWRSESHISSDSAYERSSLNSRLNSRFTSDFDSCTECLCSQHSAELNSKQEEISQLNEEIENLKQKALEQEHSINKIVKEYDAVKVELLSIQAANQAIIDSNKSLYTKEVINENLFKMKQGFAKVLQVLSSSATSTDVHLNPDIIQTNSIEDNFAALSVHLDRIKCLAEDITHNTIARAQENQSSDETEFLNKSMPIINNVKGNESLQLKENRKPRRAISEVGINDEKEKKLYMVDKHCDKKKNKQLFRDTEVVSEALTYLENVKEADINSSNLRKYREEKQCALARIGRIRDIDIALNNEELVRDSVDLRRELARLERRLHVSIKLLKSFKMKENE
uniref:Kinesin motor domain-containing protein n=1 Tax=Glossina austeni TaxID=7395 RepID=A0A1A9VBE7_GLOAU